MKLFKTPRLASPLLFGTLGIDRFIAIAGPYSHNKIMTNKANVGNVDVIYGMLFSSTFIVVSGSRTSYQGLLDIMALVAYPFEYLYLIL